MFSCSPSNSDCHFMQLNCIVFPEIGTFPHFTEKSSPKDALAAAKKLVEAGVGVVNQTIIYITL